MAKKNSIFNIDLTEFFGTGKRVKVGEMCIEENVLYYDAQILAVKSNNFLVINGDELDTEMEEERDALHNSGKKTITTSFECLENAKVKLEEMKVINVTQDLDEEATTRSKKFKDFEKSVPQGATYSEDVWEGKIQRKEYHRAGSMLIQYKGVRYICGMDEESYFVSKLQTSPQNVESAFKSLKPKRVVKYEKESGKVALRQGEWFFIPRSDLEADNMIGDYALPLQTKGENKHIVEEYEESDGRHYCKGDVEHGEHDTLYLDDVLHEAVQSTALDSWSVQGVD